MQNNPPDDAEVELSLYVNARNNLLISGNAIKLADFTVQVIFINVAKIIDMFTYYTSSSPKFSFPLMLPKQTKKFNFSVCKLYFNFLLGTNLKMHQFSLTTL